MHTLALDESFREDFAPDSPVPPRVESNERRFQATFDQAAVGILHTSLRGQILECNECFGRMVGYSPSELVGLSFQQITPAEDRDLGTDVALRLLSGDLETASFEKRYVRKDGSLTWAMLTISIQHNKDGQPLFFLTLAQDINARKDAEISLAVVQEALRVSEERYRIAFQMSLDAVNLNRMNDGLYIECNKAFLDITGYSRDEVIGHTSVELGIWTEMADRHAFLERINRDGCCRDLEVQFRKKNGKLIWGRISGSLVELDGTQSLLTVTRDVSAVKMAEDQIRYLASYDPLTELPNRTLMLERLRQTVQASARSIKHRALLVIDLDNFKMLNETQGHNVGDVLLKETARRISSSIRSIDMAARSGGDEFVVILEELAETPEGAASQVKVVAEKILAALAEPYTAHCLKCRSTASMGITLFSRGQGTSGDLLQQAEIAMHQAKTAGAQSIRFFAPSLQAALYARALLEEEIRLGIADGQFLLWYQPQVEADRVIGVEALLRWDHPQRGILAPAEFIGLAEETGLIVPLGTYALQQACAQIAKWSRGSETHMLSVAVNVSPRQFRQPDFASQVLQILERTGANPRRLKLEITESMLVENLEATIGIMNELKRHGVEFSLDDFGTGYSSLAYLKRLPLDELKIDRSFVGDMLVDPASRAIAQVIVSLSRAMHLSLVAEGVESAQQRDCLASFGCHAYQGFLFSPPVPAEEVERLLADLAAREYASN